MRDNTVTMAAQVVILDPALLSQITPMADLYAGDTKEPAYLLSGCTEPDGIFRLSKLHVSVLARDLAPILFPGAITAEEREYARIRNGYPEITA